VREALWGECHGARHFREALLEEVSEAVWGGAEEVGQELWVEYRWAREARWGGLGGYHVARELRRQASCMGQPPQR
jgi:hypothetical protein